jgi:hypothetical protein
MRRLACYRVPFARKLRHSAAKLRHPRGEIASFPPGNCVIRAKAGIQSSFAMDSGSRPRSGRVRNDVPVGEVFYAPWRGLTAVIPANAGIQSSFDGFRLTPA